MTHAYRQRLALLLIASLATLSVALTLASTSASASLSFCGGQTINNHQTCFGGARSFEWIRGHGDSTGVCVGYNETAYLACSPGAGWYAEYRWYYYIYAVPRIIGNSPNNTVGYGETL